MLGTSIARPSDWKHKFSTNIFPFGPWKYPWKTTIESTPPDSVQIPCDLGQRVQLPCIYDNVGYLPTWDSLHTIWMNGTIHNSSQTWKISLTPVFFPLILIITVLWPCRIPSRTKWCPLKKDGTLSMDLSVQNCTQFMRAPLLGPLMKIPVIIIG